MRTISRITVNLPLNPRVMVLSEDMTFLDRIGGGLVAGRFVTALSTTRAQLERELADCDGLVVDLAFPDAPALAERVKASPLGLLFPVVGVGASAASRADLVKAGFDDLFAPDDPVELVATRMLVSIRAFSVYRSTAEKAEKLMRWQDWVRYLVHDLRSPLSAALVNVSDASKADVDDDTRVGLVESVAALKRVGAMVQDLLDTSRLQRRALQLNPVMADLEALATQAIDDVAALASVRPVLHSSGDCSVWCDPGLIGRVFGNLVANAVRYAGKRPVEISLVASADRVLARVTNDGPAVPAAVRDKLFEPWAATEHGGGTGLGMAFARLALEAHGGGIWLESPEEGRVTFAFVVPRAQ